MMNSSKGKKGEIEQKPENLLENEDVELKLKESEPKIENKWSEKHSILKCEICQETVPRNLLKLINMKDDKVVPWEIFEVKGSMEISTPCACLSHILKDSKSRRRNCHVCHTSNDCTRLYTVSSKNVRILIMIGCILRGTHSVEQAIPFITANLGFSCHSNCKESIDVILEHSGVRNVPELSWCSVQAMGGLMDIVKTIDLNFAEYQFIDACRGLVIKNKTFETNL